jgi:ubiquinone/menaquinone biosynthesis C-methylase UbiE
MLSHGDHILDQFSRNADLFATAPALTNEAVLDFLIKSVRACGEDTALDVACGAGVLVCAMAKVVRHVTGIDIVPAMIDRARALAAEKQATNVTWRLGDVNRLPFADATFSVVTSRYAFHHLERPDSVLAEMARVCVPAGRILVADMAAPSDPLKAAALNRMEKLRDPSHLRSMSVPELERLFSAAGLIPETPRTYRLDFQLETLLTGSRPLAGDAAIVRELFERALVEDNIGLRVWRTSEGIQLSYDIAVLVATKS